MPVAFHAGDLKAVAKVLREAHPGAELVVCADDDRHTEGNPGVAHARAAAAAVGGLLVVPRFQIVSAVNGDSTKCNRLAHMSSLAHMGRAERPRRMLAPYGKTGSPSWRSSRWIRDRRSPG